MQLLLKYLQALLNAAIGMGSKLIHIEKQNAEILALLKRDEEIAVALTIDFKVDDQTTEGALFMTITDSQQVVATIKPVNKRGQPAPVQPGSVLWTGPSFVAITPAPDGLSATIVAMGIGSGELSVSADADLGEGVVTISGTVPFEVIPSQATSVGFEFGTPTEQTEPGPLPNPTPVP